VQGCIKLDTLKFLTFSNTQRLEGKTFMSLKYPTGVLIYYSSTQFTHVGAACVMKIDVAVFYGKKLK